ncbi:hemolysin-III related-domain-containing protein [Fusarium redolens]|uniref:Hemolysin-III related-domain-containing protein n=1 Tax=Fusarium redolens TaxID=48865 RepID=A0A9P9KNE4_FUSRE|nr:hemolysin-III related-domain-containing protein [Fusarium redolens]KAH7264851.1 hemolysin-III related-domain-containing protein [Fusarium redolens]
MSRNRNTASISPSQPLIDATEQASHDEGDVTTVGRNVLIQGLLRIADIRYESQFIQTGYRASSNSIKKSVRSILSIHNETVNIWSHILGCILFLVIPVYVFTTEIPPRYKVATREDIAVRTIYFIGVTICFFLSATCHTVSNHPSHVHHLSVQFDYLCILILMYSAMIPLIYYGFVCDHFLRNMYWGLVSVNAGLCALSTMHPRFRTVKAKAVPGRFFPGRFDIVGQSHQILHAPVIVAGMMHVMGCLGNFDYCHEHGPRCI